MITCPLPRLRPVVASDMVDARKLVKRLLEMAGATVSLASSSSEAIDRILAARPDVLVCDIGMPGEDGYSLNPAGASSRTEPSECLARCRADCLCALRGSHESDPGRVSKSSLEAGG
jgi:response regulator RpfG family c-di-GMP phosphodiesterase